MFWFAIITGAHASSQIQIELNDAHCGHLLLTAAFYNEPIYRITPVQITEFLEQNRDILSTPVWDAFQQSLNSEGFWIGLSSKKDISKFFNDGHKGSPLYRSNLLLFDKHPGIFIGYLSLFCINSLLTLFTPDPNIILPPLPISLGNTTPFVSLYAQVIALGTVMAVFFPEWSILNREELKTREQHLRQQGCPLSQFCNTRDSLTELNRLIHPFFRSISQSYLIATGSFSENNFTHSIRFFLLKLNDNEEFKMFVHFHFTK